MYRVQPRPKAKSGGSVGRFANYVTATVTVLTQINMSTGVHYCSTTEYKTSNTFGIKTNFIWLKCFWLKCGKKNIQIWNVCAWTIWGIGSQRLVCPMCFHLLRISWGGKCTVIWVQIRMRSKACNIRPEKVAQKNPKRKQRCIIHIPTYFRNMGS